MLQYHQKTVINCSTRSLQFRQPKFTSSWQVTSWSGMCDESPLWVVKAEVAWHCASFWEIKVVCKIKHSHSKLSWWQKDSKRTAAWYDTGVCRSYIFTMSHPPIILTALRNVFFIAVSSYTKFMRLFLLWPSFTSKLSFRNLYGTSSKKELNSMAAIQTHGDRVSVDTDGSIKEVMSGKHWEEKHVPHQSSFKGKGTFVTENIWI